MEAVAAAAPPTGLPKAVPAAVTAVPAAAYPANCPKPLAT